MVYLRLSNISDYLLAQRTATVQVINRVTGLRLPLSALRYVGDNRGLCAGGPHDLQAGGAAL